MIATYVATVAGLIAVAIKQRINLFDRVIVTWLGTITGAIALLVWAMSTQMTKEQITLVSSVVSNLLLLTIMVAFIGGALWKKVNVYDAFIEGARAASKLRSRSFRIWWGCWSPFPCCANRACSITC